VEGKVALKNIVDMEDFKKLRFIRKEGLISLEDKDDDSGKEIFYTHPQSPATIIPIFSN